MDECVSQGQNQIESSQVKEPVNSGSSESGALTAQEFRWYRYTTVAKSVLFIQPKITNSSFVSESFTVCAAFYTLYPQMTTWPKTCVLHYSVFLCQNSVFCVYVCMSRTALRAAFPLKSDEEIDELVASAQSEPDSSNDAISSQRLHSLVCSNRGFTVFSG